MESPQRGRGAFHIEVRPLYGDNDGMGAYETTATVGERGQVSVSSVPFDSGTQVRVIIEPAPDEQALAAARDRMRELFRTTRGFRNSPRIPREELYERGSLR
jgi:hypothetical protein